MRKIAVMIVVLIFCAVCVYAEQNYDFDKNFESYDFSELDRVGRQKGLDMTGIAKSTAEGTFEISIVDIVRYVVKRIWGEVILQSSLMKIIFCLCILCAVIKFIGSDFSGGTAKLSFYVCFLAAMSCAAVSFSQASDIILNTCEDFETALKASLPLMCSAIVSAGGIGAAAVMLPAAASVTECALKLTEMFFLPMVNVCAAVSIVNRFSDKTVLSKLSDLIALCVKQSLKLFTFLAVAILGFYRIGNAQTSDITLKIIKSGSSAVPVIGDILSSSAQTVMLFASLAKTGIAAAAIVLISTCAFVPFVKILAMTAVYKITAALIQPLGEKGITECIDAMGDTLSLLLGIIAMLIFVFLATVLIFVSISGG